MESIEDYELYLRDLWKMKQPKKFFYMTNHVCCQFGFKFSFSGN